MKSISTNGLLRAGIICAIVLSTASCRHANERLYVEVFSPPDSYLDIRELNYDSTLDPDIIAAAKDMGRSLGFNLEYEGVAAKPECGDFCLVMREPNTDHVYVVFLVSGSRIDSWMSFSQAENGR